MKTICVELEDDQALGITVLPSETARGGGYVDFEEADGDRIAWSVEA